MFNPSFQGSWLGRLRWDPRLLDYEMAQYNRMRMLGVRCIWVDQPVDSYVFPSLGVRYMKRADEEAIAGIQ